jgi:hypothetical protein
MFGKNMNTIKKSTKLLSDASKELDLEQSSTNFSPAAHPNLSKAHDGTPQNFTSRKGGTKLHMAVNMFVHINPCPIRMQTYENKT